MSTKWQLIYRYNPIANSIDDLGRIAKDYFGIDDIATCTDGDKLMELFKHCALCFEISKEECDAIADAAISSKNNELQITYFGKPLVSATVCDWLNFVVDSEQPDVVAPYLDAVHKFLRQRESTVIVDKERLSNIHLCEHCRPDSDDTYDRLFHVFEQFELPCEDLDFSRVNRCGLFAVTRSLDGRSVLLTGRLDAWSEFLEFYLSGYIHNTSLLDKSVQHIRDTIHQAHSSCFSGFAMMP